MSALDFFPRDGTREEQEAWAVAMALRGRRLNIPELGRKLIPVQEMEEPAYLKCYFGPKTDEKSASRGEIPG